MFPNLCMTSAWCMILDVSGGVLRYVVHADHAPCNLEIYIPRVASTMLDICGASTTFYAWRAALVKFDMVLQLHLSFGVESTVSYVDRVLIRRYLSPTILSRQVKQAVHTHATSNVHCVHTCTV